MSAVSEIQYDYNIYIRMVQALNISSIDRVLAATARWCTTNSETSGGERIWRQYSLGFLRWNEGKIEIRDQQALERDSNKTIYIISKIDRGNYKHFWLIYHPFYTDLFMFFPTFPPWEPCESRPSQSRVPLSWTSCVSWAPGRICHCYTPGAQE